MFRQTLEINLGIGDSKLGFWSENGILPESCLSKLAMASKLVAMASEEIVQLAMASDWWSWRVVQYNNSCFCRFRVLEADLSFLKCFFQHV